MRRVWLAAALLAAGSCGAPTAPMPASTPATVRPITLSGGSYLLAITLSATGNPVCQNGLCTSSSVCSGNPPRTTASFMVNVERSGDSAFVRIPGTATPLVLSLRVASDAVSGTIAGSALDASGVSMDAAGTVTGGAPADGSIAVAGTIDGQLSVTSGSCSNNGHTWSLAPR